MTKTQSKAARIEHGKQGFASMPKEKVKAIASKGGKASHSGSSHSYKNEKSDKSSSSHKQGLAARLKDKVKEIAGKSGINH